MSLKEYLECHFGHTHIPTSHRRDTTPAAAGRLEDKKKPAKQSTLRVSMATTPDGKLDTSKKRGSDSGRASRKQQDGAARGADVQLDSAERVTGRGGQVYVTKNTTKTQKQKWKCGSAQDRNEKVECGEFIETEDTAVYVLDKTVELVELPEAENFVFEIIPLLCFTFHQ